MSVADPTASGWMPTGTLRQGIMLAVSLVFLVLVGIILPHGESGESFRESLRQHASFVPLLVGLWVLVIGESLAGLFIGPDAWSARLKRLLLVSVLPPLRMTTATNIPSGWVWLPISGWRRTGPEASERLEQRLALPMLILTMLVLPVLGAEMVGGEALENRPRLQLAVHLTTCLIWTGFTAEFIWMVSATPQKLTYCLKNWVNLVIILLPLVAFLRVLNFFRFTRMLRAGKLLRAYRLRGLWARAWRLALLFDLFERLQKRNPAKYCAGLEKKITDLEAEVSRLRGKLDDFRDQSLTK